MPPRSFSEDGAFGASNAAAAPAPASPAGAPAFGQAPAFGRSAPRSSSWRGGGLSLPGILNFADGGAIDTGDNDSFSNGSPQQDAITRALSTVDGVLAYGRKLHGLGAGDDEGAIKGAGTQMAGAMPMIPGSQSESGIPPRRPAPPPGRLAANMPAIPGSQSESGIKPQQPMPGPLPPTSNPFGKRADAGSDQDQDGDSDAPGAIDTDEETA